ETGVVAEGPLDQPGWVKAEIDLDLVAQSRADGNVLLFRHWPESADAVSGAGRANEKEYRA
ncbi:hypothetical protein Q0P04_14175, partial [Staphylococcus aureus]|nr:hypothetical protein [Staphylococcus aureus]